MREEPWKPALASSVMCTQVAIGLITRAHLTALLQRISHEGHCDGLEAANLPCVFCVLLVCHIDYAYAGQASTCLCLLATLITSAVQVDWTELNRKNMDPVLAARTVVEQQMVGRWDRIA
eukprot:scaffold58899_cov24-Tisochrysis_lutea.AAC.1